MWQAAGSLPSADRIDAMWQALRRRMHEGEGGVEWISPRERPVLSLETARAQPRRRLWIASAVAATLVLALGAGLLWRGLGTEPVREFATPPGQRVTVKLADGSQVELGVASKLQMRVTRLGRRELHLEGEAVFDVVHDERRPFVVYAGNAVTQDVGTRFAIKAYAGDPEVRVVVVSGKVALRAARAGAATAAALLGPRALARLDAAGRTTVTPQIDPETYLAWTSGRLVFHQAQLREVAEQMGRWFDVTVDVPDPAVAGRRVTLDMPATSLDPVLAAVTVPLGLRAVRIDHHIVLEP